MKVPGKRPRGVSDILADIERAARAAADLLSRGKAAWDHDELLQLAGEAVIGRIADAANRLPDDVKAEMPEVPWDDIRDIRIVVDHIYHRIDYDALWQTLGNDVPRLLSEIRHWRDR